MQDHILVTIGVINQQAQKGATVVPAGDAGYSYLSNLERPLNNYDVEFEYVTLEDDWYKLDGSMLFPPRPEDADYLFNGGIITEDICGTIRLAFDNAYDIRGLTIDFGRSYPADFTISNGSKTIQITDNAESYWTTDEILENTEQLTIQANRMANGQCRLRIHKILMGIGISFENKKIKSSTKAEFVSPISEELPTLDFTMTIGNKDREFDVENRESAIHYLEVGQEVTVRYGYEITEGGPITWMDGCVCNLSDWEADDESMSFTAKDKIDALDGTYYRGRYRADGISLHDLAVDVLTDAGLDERQYSLDPYLQSVIVYNPLPVLSRKECLQIIANAGRCKLYTDRAGIICIKAAFITVLSPERITMESDHAVAWSDLQSVVNGETQYEYASLSQDHYRLDGTMYFLPRDASNLSAGFVSKAVADAEGNFEQNPTLTIKLEAAMTYYGLRIKFSANPPESVTIHTYREGELRESYEVSAIGLDNTITHDFPEFDTLVLEFTKGAPNSRIFLESVIFGDVTDYKLTYRGMRKYPKGIQCEKVSKVLVARTTYSAGNEMQNLATETVDVTGLSRYTLYFNDASYGVCVTAGDTALTVLDGSDYYVTVDVSTLSGSQELSADGMVYRTVSRWAEMVVDTTGKTERWENPLISTDEHAALLGEWLANYFANNIEYEIDYRGEPRLDAGDIVFLENKYVDNLQIQIYEHQLQFNGALSGSIKANRAMAERGGMPSNVADT